jgi:hypothetical protein
MPKHHDKTRSTAATPELLHATGSPTGNQSIDHHTNGEYQNISGGEPAIYIPPVTNARTRLIDNVAKIRLDFFAESPTATAPLRPRDRIVAAALAALCFHSAILLFSISYHLDLEKSSISTLGCVTSVCAALYWIGISGLIFSGYTRNADFAHVFRLSIQFQIFILTIGSLGTLIASKLFALLPK